MSRFYLMLPSNSSINYYPENTVARFTTKLLNNIDLDGECEVGLSEIYVPSHVYIVIEGLCYYDIYLANTQNKCHAGVIQTSNLIAELHHAQREQIPPQSHEVFFVEFSYESDSGKVKMAYLASTPSRIQVEFSPDMARLFGYSPKIRYTQQHSRVSKFPPDMRGRIHSVYVYCQIYR